MRTAFTRLRRGSVALVGAAVASGVYIVERPRSIPNLAVCQARSSASVSHTASATAVSCSFMHAVPKTDLHVHLDGSLRIETLIGKIGGNFLKIPDLAACDRMVGCA